jgi:group I intron endonuclease
MRNARNGVFGKLYNAMRKDGVENFLCEVLCWGEDHDLGMSVVEPLMIEMFNPEYNLTRGGNGLPRHSQSTKDRMHLSKLGSNNPSYGKTGTFSNKTHTEETKKIIREKRARQIIPKDKKYGRPDSWGEVNVTKKECPHCGSMSTPGNSKRWHFDKCKKVINGETTNA